MSSCSKRRDPVRFIHSNRGSSHSNSPNALDILYNSNLTSSSLLLFKQQSLFIKFKSIIFLFLLFFLIFQPILIFLSFLIRSLECMQLGFHTGHENETIIQICCSMPKGEFHDHHEDSLSESSVGWANHLQPASCTNTKILKLYKMPNSFIYTNKHGWWIPTQK